jgi:translation initiation factor 1 (eIF-1/SUI1)
LHPDSSRHILVFRNHLQEVLLVENNEQSEEEAQFAETRVPCRMKKKKKVRIVVSPQRYRDVLSTIAKLNNFSSAKDDVQATIQRKKSSPSLFQQNFREEIYSKILQVSVSLCQNLKPHNVFPQKNFKKGSKIL